jgi:hypothetical protein
MSLVLFPVCFPKNSETLLKLDAKDHRWPATRGQERCDLPRNRVDINLPREIRDLCCFCTIPPVARGIV